MIFNGSIFIKNRDRLVNWIDKHTIEKGLNSSFKDFEDALQYFSATESKCELIISRNGKDFKKSLIPVMTPFEFLKSLIKK